MYALLRYYETGELGWVQPVATREPAFPEPGRAEGTEGLCVALRAEVNDYKPQVCSYRFLAGRCGWRFPMRAGRALRSWRRRA